MIRDTSATDRAIAPTGNPNRRRLLILIACAVGGVALLTTLAATPSCASVSFVQSSGRAFLPI